MRGKIAALSNNDILEIIIDDGVDGFGSSFLTEGFAGMVKYGYISSNELLRKIEIKLTDPEFEFFRNKIISYITDAKFDSEVYEATRRPE